MAGPPENPATLLPPPATGAVRSLVVTVAAAAAAVAATRVPVPGLDLTALGVRDSSFLGLLRATATQPALAQVGVLALGLMPFISAYTIVELLAVIVPTWRSLRVGGYDERARLYARTRLLAFALAAVQAYFVAVWLQSFRVSPYPPLLGRGPLARLYVVAVLVTGCCALAWLAGALGRWGLGNGYAVLIAATALLSSGGKLVGAARERLAAGDRILGPLALLIVTITAFVWVFRRQRLREGGRTEAPELPVPASGLVPLIVSAWILQLPATMANFGLDPLGLSERLVPGAALYITADVIVTLAAGAVLAWGFNLPANVAPLWARDQRLGAAGGRLDGAARSALRRATGVTLALLALLLAAAWLVVRAGLGLDLVTVVVMTAVAVDLAGEYRFHREHGPLVAVWPLHRLYALDPALRALHGAGVPAFPRARCYRSLWHFFAPFAPVEILVPEALGEQADRLLRELFAEPASPAVAATATPTDVAQGGSGPR